MKCKILAKCAGDLQEKGHFFVQQSCKHGLARLAD